MKGNDCKISISTCVWFLLHVSGLNTGDVGAWTAWQPYWALWSWLPSFLRHLSSWTHILPAVNQDSLFDAYMPPWQSTDTAQIKQAIQITDLLYGWWGWFTSSFIELSPVQNVPNKGKDWAFSLFFFLCFSPLIQVWDQWAWRLEAVQKNSEALSGHSFCFFGSECLEV